MKRYITIRAGERILIWDFKKRKMHERNINEDVFSELDVTLDMFVKFCPYAEELKQTNTFADASRIE